MEKGPKYVLVTENTKSKIYEKCSGITGCSCGYAYHTCVAEIPISRNAERVLRALLAAGGDDDGY